MDRHFSQGSSELSQGFSQETMRTEHGKKQKIWKSERGISIMKRYEEIENMILSRDLTDEEVMILNEATLMKNVVEFQKNKVKNQ